LFFFKLHLFVSQFKFPKPLNKITLSQNGVTASDFSLSPVDPDLYVICMANGTLRMGKLSEINIHLEKGLNAVCGKFQILTL
jgi:hypothetical protein